MKHFLSCAPFVLLAVLACSEDPVETTPLDAGAEEGALPDGAGPGFSRTPDGGGAVDSANATDSAVGGDTAVPGDDAGPGVFSMEPADSTGAVVGTVTDGAGSPLGGVTVTVGALAPVKSDSDGTFVIEGVPTGLTKIKLEAPGYVSQTRELGVPGGQSEEGFVLAASGATENVGAAAKTVTRGTTELLFAASTYAADTPVTVTWLGGNNVVFGSGSPTFYDQGSSVMRRAVGLLDVQAAAQPTKPVTMRVATDAPMGELALYELDAEGNWSNRVAPTSVSGGFATFQVSHFSEYGVFRDSQPGLTVRAAGANSRWTPPGGGAPNAFVIGTTLPFGSTMFVTDASQAVTLVAPDGGTIVVERGGVRIVLGATGPEFQAMGSARVLGSASPARYNPFSLRNRVRSRAVVMGVRGTVYRATLEECGSRDIAELQVSQGTVELTSGGVTRNVTAGQRVRTCSGCPDSQRIECCGGTGASCSQASGFFDCCSRTCGTDNRCGCTRNNSDITCRSDADCCSGFCALRVGDTQRRCWARNGQRPADWSDCYQNSYQLATCVAHGAGMECRSSQDCASGVCQAGICAKGSFGKTCYGSQDCLARGCGGTDFPNATCGKGHPASPCRTGADCTSNVCNQGVCRCTTQPTTVFGASCCPTNGEQGCNCKGASYGCESSNECCEYASTTSTCRRSVTEPLTYGRCNFKSN